MFTRIVRSYMRAEVPRIGRESSLLDARELMRTANVRHLLVMEGEGLAGVISQRDVYLLEALQNAEPERATVEEAMDSEPYTVSPAASLEEVARRMWTQRSTSAVIVDGTEVLGIFTTSDALRALAEVLSLERGETAPQAAASGEPTAH